MHLSFCGRLPAAVVSLALLALPFAAAAQDDAAARRLAARELVTAMQSMVDPGRMVRGMAGAMEQQMLGAVRQQNQHLDEAQQRRVAQVLSAEMVSAVDELVRAAMPQVMESYEALYASRFTVAELRELARFYASPVGRKSVAVIQDDLPAAMAPMMERMQQQAPALAQRMQRAIESLRAEGISLK